MARRKTGSASAAGPGRANLAYARFLNSQRTYVAALVMGLLVLGGLVYIYVPFGGSTGGEAKAAPTVVTTTPPAPTTNAEGAINGCLRQPAVDLLPEQVVNTPIETEWVATGQMSVPTSPTGGPGIPGPPSRCFTRTPEGALYSIGTFVAEMAGTNSNEEKVEVISRRALHDSNYNAYVAKLSADTPVTGEPQFRISGYRWSEYSPQRVVVEIQLTLLSGPTATSTNSLLYGVIWAENDWKLLAPSPGSPISLPDAQFRSFHPWGGTV